MTSPGTARRLSWPVAIVLLASLVVGGVSSAEPGPDAASAAERRAPALATSPSTYVAGQAITFTGNIGRAGVRNLVMQFHMNRPGDGWETVRNFSARTAADGSFSFVHPAPGMYGVRYRVASLKPRAATPPVTFDAKTQDLTIAVEAREEDGWDGRIVAGYPFDISVDTTPVLLRRPETQGLPVFVGRPLFLQRRLSPTSWETIATGAVDAEGNAQFRDLTAGVGTHVYRVVQGAVTTGGSQIGWLQSFPAHVTVLDPATALQTPWPPPGGVWGDRGRATGALGRASRTAGETRKWFPTIYDFTWEGGQSLDTPPSVGTRLRGSWEEYSDGSGRVSRLNGGLMLDSQRNAMGGPGDFGTTRATLRGNAMKYGRWETRVRFKTGETGLTDYRTLVELVPESGADACGRGSITIAEISPDSRTMTFGTRSATTQWSGTAAITDLVSSAPAVAVEVGRRHLTWFVDGKVVGVIKSRKAVPGTKMTLRLSMVGDAVTEYNQTSLHSDWQRAFPLKTGRQTTSGPALKTSSAPACRG